VTGASGTRGASGTGDASGYLSTGSWSVPEPALPAGVHPVLADTVRAAAAAFDAARRAHDRAALAEIVATGADGTPTMRIDLLVEEAITEVAQRHRVNVLSEEVGSVDVGSAVTLVVDPLDGSANAAAGVPLSCVAGALAVDGVVTEALTCWLEAGRCWHARAGEPTGYRTSGRRELDGAAVSLLRPHPRNADAWWRVTRRASRVRILSSSCLEAALVAEGATDAFADAGSDTHRIVDLAAAMLMVPAAGGAVLDAAGRPLELDLDLTRRWSGVVAATPQLAEELVAEIAGRGAADAAASG
jgi:myo-inositol-1(or 4)-monophosphatase